MANPEHLAILKKGVEEWNRWRYERPKIRPELLEAVIQHASLERVNLRGANLAKTGLSVANLRGANLREADLCGADLTVANLLGANLHGANLIGADLRWANFNGADLSGANLREVDLREADLTGAFIGSTTFANVDLSEVKGLEAVKHGGPSSIGIDTIYRSKGKIPYIFLRGTGIPDLFISYIASLVGTGIEFYSLFISYSTHNQEFAERLYADLQVKGVRCWFAPHKLRGGEKLYEQIDEAIRVYDKLLLILSPASMGSEWVNTEISRARKREIKDGKRILFPIRLCAFETLRDWELFDADSGKDLAREIREYYIPDFSNWKDHDAYKLAFDRLLKDLQGKPEPPTA